MINHQKRYAPVVGGTIYLQCAALTKNQLEEILKLDHWQHPLLKATKQFIFQTLF